MSFSQRIVRFFNSQRNCNYLVIGDITFNTIYWHHPQALKYLKL